MFAHRKAQWPNRKATLDAQILGQKRFTIADNTPSARAVGIVNGGLEGRMAIRVDQPMQCLAHHGQKTPFKADSQSFDIFDAILPSSFGFPGGIKA
jgi:hypothetical protein